MKYTPKVRTEIKMLFISKTKPISLELSIFFLMFLEISGLNKLDNEATTFLELLIIKIAREYFAISRLLEFIVRMIKITFRNVTWHVFVRNAIMV